MHFLSRRFFRTSTFLAVSFVALLSQHPAFAADIVVESRVDKVQIFPGGATLTLLGNISLPAGTSTLLFENFPVFVDLNTVKASGVFSEGVTIRSINNRMSEAVLPTSARLVPLQEELVRMQDQQRRYADDLKSAQAQLTVVEEFSRLAARGFTEALSSRPDAMADWGAVLAAIKTGNDKGHADIRAINELMRGTKKEMVALETRIAQMRKTLSRRSIAVEIIAESAAQGEIQLNYQTPQASWSASYDALLDIDESDPATLNLVQLANVTQSTGRDWNNVALSLSTTRPAYGTQAPKLASIRIFERAAYEDEMDANGLPDALKLKSEHALGVNSAYNFAAKPAALGGARQQLVMQAAMTSTTLLENAGFQAIYVVQGRVSIPGNGQTRRYTIAQHSLSPELLAVAVPFVQKVAFLHAQLKNETGGALLAGPLALYRNNVFVGRGNFNFMAVGDSQSIGFGVDDKVSIDYVIEDRSVGEQGIINTEKTDTRRTTIKVENRHAKNIRIRVLGRVPYSENDTIKVVRLPGFTKPTSENVGNQRGVLSWSYMYESGEKRDIALSYRLSWPSDINVEIQE
ncbi:MAG: mucoidy inhibitor MuiA family protein [Rhizobiales bacterium]|nr:mucoidy inhibitor MuiA family protein [Hyphomicrobiales bacterium]